MSDCLKCWETPCSCGYDYQDWQKERKKKIIKAIANNDVDILRQCIDELDFVNNSNHLSEK